jgi:hypothetical protein
MRYIVLDTDVASRAIKGKLGDPLAARLTGMACCVTFVTVGELWQWAVTRSWGTRTREELDQWLGRVVVLDSDDAARVAKFDACASRASSRWDGARPYCCSNRAARARRSAVMDWRREENSRIISPEIPLISNPCPSSRASQTTPNRARGPDPGPPARPGDSWAYLAKRQSRRRGWLQDACGVPGNRPVREEAPPGEHPADVRPWPARRGPYPPAPGSPAPSGRMTP